MNTRRLTQGSPSRCNCSGARVQGSGFREEPDPSLLNHYMEGEACPSREDKTAHTRFALHMAWAFKTALTGDRGSESPSYSLKSIVYSLQSPLQCGRRTPCGDSSVSGIAARRAPPTFNVSALGAPCSTLFPLFNVGGALRAAILQSRGSRLGEPLLHSIRSTVSLPAHSVQGFAFSQSGR
jgi:hypothetical protein